MTDFDSNRRQLLKGAAVAAGGAVAASRLAPEAQAAAQPASAATSAATAATAATATISVRLRVNGAEHQLMVDPRTTLLDALRERLHLTGTKKGCDQGQCGACTVIVDGRRSTSCLTLAVMQEGHDITTIEGLGTPNNLHPMQAAFIKHDGYQCGFCTPGQICSAVAMLDEVKKGGPSHVTADINAVLQPTDAEFRERMSGNLCRCGAYSNIQAAIAEVAGVRR
ncbi:aldehyde dehydrogenase iron-sulfur subunit PaoA [Massilia psychrophila]|uniref:Aldehyde dehydrogenase iron-sulfur subunit n=1 Tax=Massilia psychrophila TaxID=1603353 RepID=A0A2G8T4M0_9BURK|nr:aldehyde dehydrogenase iron-sulfur subunit PaoA [Massilia psychrophila]PIL40981.1 aldehyde dehydrogenase iron-sulfur subunit [Massilia psychrophila]GGE68765.1 aldehyde dehydrogenase iron-sulfur subunit [Massilia psychrophila]